MQVFHIHNGRLLSPIVACKSIKALMSSMGNSTPVEQSWARNAEHVTGFQCSLHVVMFRTRRCVAWKVNRFWRPTRARAFSPDNLQNSRLLSNSDFFHDLPWSGWCEKYIFNKWEALVLKERTSVFEQFKRIVNVLAGLGAPALLYCFAHSSYWVVETVSLLPFLWITTTEHRAVDFTAFLPFKIYFRTALNCPALSLHLGSCNDIYALWAASHGVQRSTNIQECRFRHSCLRSASLGDDSSRRRRLWLVKR